jgi:DNA adenine methylase
MQQSIINGRTRSLLRYPGSKARLAKFIAEVIAINGFHQPSFVEPFCGGSSVSIALLESNLVGNIIINDIDPIVGSLWKCVFSDDNAKWLADAIMHAPLTLDFWKFQKHLEPLTLREMALKCLYLNRTSFSGVLHRDAGPIGGYSQAKWTIGCRFNREKLASRILELSSYANRVEVLGNVSWFDACESLKSYKNVFFYLDPPFYYKAQRLYRVTFNDAEHKTLSEYLGDFEQPWLLSYDNAAGIRDLYSTLTLNARIIDNTYSAHPMGGNSFVGRELIYSNLKHLPMPENEHHNHKGFSVRNFEHFSNFMNTKKPIATPCYV